MKKTNIILNIAVMLILTACAQTHYKDSITPIQFGELGQHSITSKVLASTSEWRNSGVLITEGNRYKITASGKWALGPTFPWCGPDGLGCYSLIAFPVTPAALGGYSLGSLIAKIGKEGEPFYVGNRHEFTAEIDGVLYFRINDTDAFCGDNSGYAHVEISQTSTGHSGNANFSSINKTATHQKTARLKSNFGKKWAVIIGISQYKYSGQDGLTIGIPA